MGVPMGIGFLGHHAQQDKAEMRKQQGFPLQKLSARKRTQLTSHGQGHSSNVDKPHQGNREQQRRAKQQARYLGSK